MENNNKIFLSEMDIFATVSQSKITKVNPKSDQLISIRNEINMVSDILSELVTKVNKLATRIELIAQE